jgi:hypothetical protein
MTEAEWLAATDPTPMLEFVKGKVSDRKLRLLACTWCRAVWYQLANNLCRAAVELSERAADDSSVISEMAKVREAAWATSTDTRGFSHSGRKGAGYNAALYASIGEMWHMGIVLESTQLLATRPGFRHRQCEMIREMVYVLPFRPMTADPSWLTSSVLALAEGIYADRAFDRMPILADALQDAGCDNTDILNHCRGDGPHVRGCWVVDLLLGKE